MKVAALFRLALGTSSFGLASIGSAQIVAAPASATDGVQDIVVTAQKREERLQDVPVAVTALTAASLAANRVANLRDLDGLAPNLTVRTTQGGIQSPTFSMRGLVTSGTSAGADKGVAIYIDGVFLGASIGSSFDLADIERIEVLRGPQGTLFGRNSTGGAISITTRQPSGELAIRQEITIGNYDQFRTLTSVDLPSWGPLSVRMAYVHSERQGDMRNLGGGTRWDYSGVTNRYGILTSPDRLGGFNNESVSASAKLDLAQNFTLLYRFDHAWSDYSASGVGLVQGLIPAKANPALVGLLTALQASQPASAQLTPVSSRRPKAVNNWLTMPAENRAGGHSLTAIYDVSDAVTFKNVLARRRTSNRSPGFQLDGSGGYINTVQPAPLAGQPYILTASNASQFDRQWSDEFQANISIPVMELTLGGLHYSQRVRRGPLGRAPSSFAFRTIPNFVIPSSTAVPSVINIRSDGLFGQAEVHLSDTVDAVGGIRYTWDRKTGVDNTITNLSIPIDYRDSRPTYLAGINFKPDRNQLYYAKYSTGFISGGVLASLTYQPETARSWEAGAKVDWFDRRLRTNLALYRVKYRGIQSNNLGSNFGVPAAPQVLINAGDARVSGFEFESTIAPTRGLSFSANFGYTRFKYTRLDPVVIRSGAAAVPTQRPKWTGNFSGQYETAPLISDIILKLRADASYRSRTTLATVVLDPTIVPLTTVDHSWIVNGRAELAGFSLSKIDASIAFWGRNIFNNKKMTTATTLQYVIPVDYERARTFGIDLTASF